ncbi:MAG: hypothetical protein ACOCTI_07205 [Phycisphaeraceae bacterium]
MTFRRGDILIWNFHFAWCWVLAGLLAGAVIGLFFADEQWLGGYGSWRRRMLRLAHVAFFGTAGLNLALALSLVHVGDAAEAWARVASWALALGAVLMPAVCGLAAWRKPMRQLFFLPVGSLLVGVGAMAVLVLRGGG